MGLVGLLDTRPRPSGTPSNLEGELDSPSRRRGRACWPESPLEATKFTRFTRFREAGGEQEVCGEGVWGDGERDFLFFLLY